METKTLGATRARFVTWGCLLSAIGLGALFGPGPDEGLLAAIPGSTAMPNCTVAALSAFNIADVTVTSATEVAAAGSDPAYCSVIGSVATHGDGAGPGEATFRAKLPVAWNNKYLASGPGGLSGTNLR
jgi:hypothetical protein